MAELESNAFLDIVKKIKHPDSADILNEAYKSLGKLFADSKKPFDLTLLENGLGERLFALCFSDIQSLDQERKRNPKTVASAFTCLGYLSTKAISSFPPGRRDELDAFLAETIESTNEKHLLKIALWTVSIQRVLKSPSDRLIRAIGAALFVNRFESWSVTHEAVSAIGSLLYYHQAAALANDQHWICGLVAALLNNHAAVRREAFARIFQLLYILQPTMRIPDFLVTYEQARRAALKPQQQLPSNVSKQGPAVANSARKTAAAAVADPIDVEAPVPPFSRAPVPLTNSIKYAANLARRRALTRLRQSKPAYNPKYIIPARVKVPSNRRSIKVVVLVPDETAERVVCRQQRHLSMAAQNALASQMLDESGGSLRRKLIDALSGDVGRNSSPSMQLDAVRAWGYSAYLMGHQILNHTDLVNRYLEIMNLIVQAILNGKHTDSLTSTFYHAWRWLGELFASSMGPRQSWWKLLMSPLEKILSNLIIPRKPIVIDSILGAWQHFVSLLAAHPSLMTSAFNVCVGDFINKFFKRRGEVLFTNRLPWLTDVLARLLAVDPDEAAIYEPGLERHKKGELSEAERSVMLAAWSVPCLPVKTGPGWFSDRFMYFFRVLNFISHAANRVYTEQNAPYDPIVDANQLPNAPANLEARAACRSFWLNLVARVGLEAGNVIAQGDSAAEVSHLLQKLIKWPFMAHELSTLTNNELENDNTYTVSPLIVADYVVSLLESLTPGILHASELALQDEGVTMPSNSAVAVWTGNSASQSLSLPPDTAFSATLKDDGGVQGATYESHGDEYYDDDDDDSNDQDGRDSMARHVPIMTLLRRVLYSGIAYLDHRAVIAFDDEFIGVKESQEKSNDKVTDGAQAEWETVKRGKRSAPEPRPAAVKRVKLVDEGKSDDNDKLLSSSASHRGVRSVLMRVIEAVRPSMLSQRDLVRCSRWLQWAPLSSLNFIDSWSSFAQSLTPTLDTVARQVPQTATPALALRRFTPALSCLLALAERFCSPWLQQRQEDLTLDALYYAVNVWSGLLKQLMPRMALTVAGQHAGARWLSMRMLSLLCHTDDSRPPLSIWSATAVASIVAALIEHCSVDALFHPSTATHFLKLLSEALIAVHHRVFFDAKKSAEDAAAKAGVTGDRKRKDVPKAETQLAVDFSSAFTSSSPSSTFKWPSESLMSGLKKLFESLTDKRQFSLLISSEVMDKFTVHIDWPKPPVSNGDLEAASERSMRTTEDALESAWSALSRTYNDKYSVDLLEKLKDFIVAGLENKHRSVCALAVDSWNSTFGGDSSLDITLVDKVNETVRNLLDQGVQIVISAPKQQQQQQHHQGEEELLENRTVDEDDDFPPTLSSLPNVPVSSGKEKRAGGEVSVAVESELPADAKEPLLEGYAMRERKRKKMEMMKRIEKDEAQLIRKEDADMQAVEENVDEEKPRSPSLSEDMKEEVERTVAPVQPPVLGHSNYNNNSHFRDKRDRNGPGVTLYNAIDQSQMVDEERDYFEVEELQEGKTRGAKKMEQSNGSNLDTIPVNQSNDIVSGGKSAKGEEDADQFQLALDHLVHASRAPLSDFSASELAQLQQSATALTAKIAVFMVQKKLK